LAWRPRASHRHRAVLRSRRAPHVQPGSASSLWARSSEIRPRLNLRRFFATQMPRARRGEHRDQFVGRWPHHLPGVALALVEEVEAVERAPVPPDHPHREMADLLVADVAAGRRKPLRYDHPRRRVATRFEPLVRHGVDSMTASRVIGQHGGNKTHREPPRRTNGHGTRIAAPTPNPQTGRDTPRRPARLKIRCPKGRVGSIPTFGTGAF
jgi:hypothetical protein